MLILVAGKVWAQPTAPTLFLPSTSSINQPASISLKWNAVAFADTYRIQVSTDSLFGSTFVDDSTVGNVSGQGIQSYPVSGLSNNTRYFWRVSATNVAGTGPFSSMWNFTTITSVPPIPTLSVPTNGAINQPTTVVLSWGPVAGAVSYHLQVSLDSTFGLRSYDSTITATSKTLSSLSNITTYYWRVSAVNIGGASNYSAMRSFSTIISTPTLISPASGSLNQSIFTILNWNPVPYADSCHVQVGTDSLFSGPLLLDIMLEQVYGQTTQSFGPAGLANNTKYYWRVSAKNSNVTTSYSPTANFTTIIAVPGVPTLTTPINGSMNQPVALTLSWNPSPNATSYKIQVSTDSLFGSFFVNDSSVTTPTKKAVTLSFNTTYFWRVVAKNYAGSSDFSPTFRLTTTLPTPTLLAPLTSAIDQSITPTLQWTAVAGAAQYRLQVATNSLFSPCILDDSTITTNSQVLSPLLNSTSYYWRVLALNTQASSAFASSFKFTTAVPPPLAPTLLLPLDQQTNIPISTTLTWNPSAGAATYRVRVATDSLFTAIVVNDSTLTTPTKLVSALIGATKYYWNVSAKNPGGTSAASQVRSFSTVVGIPTLTSPVNNASGQSTSLTFQWSVVSGASGYRLQVSTTSLFDTLVLDDSTVAVNSRLVSSLLNSTKYYWRVCAFGASGPGVYSASSILTTTFVVPPIPVLTSPNSGASQQPQSVTLNWNSSYGALTYRVQVSLDSSFQQLVINDSTVATNSRLVLLSIGNSTYFWRVNAKNSAGTSVYSAASNFVTGLFAPSLIVPSNGAIAQSIRPAIKWTTASGATAYRLQLSSNPSFASTVFDDSTIVDTVRTVGPLTSNSLFYWRVSSRNNSGVSPFPVASSFTTIMDPPDPPALQIPANGANNQPTSITFSWTASPGAVGYRIQVSTDSLFGSLILNDSAVASPSRVLAGLSPNFTYYWRVSAKNAGGFGSFSTPWSFSMITAIPTAPNLVLPINGSLSQSVSCQLSWSPVPGATAYSLKVSTDTLFGTILFSDTTLTSCSAQMTGLAYNTTIYWKVAAKNSKGIGPSSTVWKFTTTIAAPIPTFPYYASTNQPTDLTLTWNGTTSATGYQIQVALDSLFLNIVFNDSTPVLNTWRNNSFAYGTTYYWHVRARNSAATSAYSSAWVFTTVSGPPAIPVLIDPASGSVNQPVQSILKWHPSPGTANYQLQISTDTPFRSLIYNDSSITDTVRAISSLQYNTTYYWRVKSRNIGGSLGYSEVWSFVTTLQPPSVPRPQSPPSSTVIQPTSITLQWSATAGASRYRLQISTDTPFQSCVLEDSTVTDTLRHVGPLSNNMRYYWRVRGENPASKGSYSDIWNFLTAVAPPSTPGLALPANASVNVSATSPLRWNASVGAQRYDIQISDDTPFNTMIFEDSTRADTMCIASSLKPGTRYYWRVRAVNPGGASSFSAIWNFTTLLTSGVMKDGTAIPKNFVLNQNYPNPFNPGTTIRFGVPSIAHVAIKVFDILGRQIESLLNENLDAGYYQVRWNAGSRSSGVYFYSMTGALSEQRGTSTFTQIKKMLFLR